MSKRRERLKIEKKRQKHGHWKKIKRAKRNWVRVFIATRDPSNMDKLTINTIPND